MEKNAIPATEKELADWMKENCYNFSSYSIDGNTIYEGFGIDREYESFSWYYTERGNKQTLKVFRTEQEIIAYAYQQLKSDIWASRHCIGFTSDVSKSEELCNILTDMKIPFYKDQIPYYGIDRPVYRTYVSGCDIKKTGHLKEKYYTI